MPQLATVGRALYSLAMRTTASYSFPRRAETSARWSRCYLSPRRTRRRRREGYRDSWGASRLEARWRSASSAAPSGRAEERCGSPRRKRPVRRCGVLARPQRGGVIELTRYRKPSPAGARRSSSIRMLALVWHDGAMRVPAGATETALLASTGVRPPSRTPRRWRYADGSARRRRYQARKSGTRGPPGGRARSNARRGARDPRPPALRFRPAPAGRTDPRRALVARDRHRGARSDDAHSPPDDGESRRGLRRSGADSGWRFGRSSARPALAAWRTMADALGAPSSCARVRSGCLPAGRGQRPQPADSGWSTLTAAVAETRDRSVFVLGAPPRAAATGAE